MIYMNSISKFNLEWVKMKSENYLVIGDVWGFWRCLVVVIFLLTVSFWWRWCWRHSAAILAIFFQLLWTELMQKQYYLVWHIYKGEQAIGFESDNSIIGILNSNLIFVDSYCWQWATAAATTRGWYAFVCRMLMQLTMTMARCLVQQCSLHCLLLYMCKKINHWHIICHGIKGQKHDGSYMLYKYFTVNI